MGKSIAPTRTKPLPIQGMLRRNKSGDGLTPLLPPPRLNSNRLPKSTLHKIFAAMLAGVFVSYCVLMMLMMHHHHRDESVFETEGKWGPTIAASHKVLRDHIQQLSDQRRKTLDEELLRQQRIQDDTSKAQVNNNTEKARKVAVGPLGQSANTNGGFFPDLEETDIHDMRPPDAIQKSKAQEGQAVTSKRKSSPILHFVSRDKNVGMNSTSQANNNNNKTIETDGGTDLAKETKEKTK